ncbi:MAG: hypothetical protein ACYCXG_03065 [Acidiferrobacter sp.]
MYPKPVYEGLPFLYVTAAWLSIKALIWPYAWVPAAAFVCAAAAVWVQRWYYRRQLRDETGD